MEDKPKVYKLGVTGNDRSKGEEKGKPRNYLADRTGAEDLDEGPSEAEEGLTCYVVDMPGLFRTRRSIFAEKVESCAGELRFYSQDTLISAFSAGSWKSFHREVESNLSKF